MSRLSDCVNPWCRGEPDGGCGRTPQEHLEQGVTYEKFAAAYPPPDPDTPEEKQ